MEKFSFEQPKTPRKSDSGFLGSLKKKILAGALLGASALRMSSAAEAQSLENRTPKTGDSMSEKERSKKIMETCLLDKNTEGQQNIRVEVKGGSDFDKIRHEYGVIVAEGRIYFSKDSIDLKRHEGRFPIKVEISATTSRALGPAGEMLLEYNEKKQEQEVRVLKVVMLRFENSDGSTQVTIVTNGKIVSTIFSPS